MRKWLAKLNRRERNHLREMGITTLREAKKNAAFQETLKCPCWDCVSIGLKLGLKIDPKNYYKT